MILPREILFMLYREWETSSFLILELTAIV